MPERSIHPKSHGKFQPQKKVRAKLGEKSNNQWNRYHRDFTRNKNSIGTEFSNNVPLVLICTNHMVVPVLHGIYRIFFTKAILISLSAKIIPTTIVTRKTRKVLVMIQEFSVKCGKQARRKKVFSVEIYALNRIHELLILPRWLHSVLMFFRGWYCISSSFWK